MAIDPRRIRRRRVARYSSLSLTSILAGALLLAGRAADAQVQPTAEASSGAEVAGNGGAPRNPWRFQPSLSIDETYSDNINLAAKGSERSDLVTTISPSLRITRYGPWLTFTTTYTPQLLYYAQGTNGSYVRNYLNAAADATLVQNLLFFTARADVSQQNVSPFGTQGAGTVNGSSNSTETRSYSLGPSLRSRFGNDLSYSAGYQFSSSGSDSNAYSTSHTSTLYGNFESGTSYRNLGYTATYSRSEQDYGGNGKIIVESISNGLNYIVTPTIRARLNVGYDHNQYPTSGQPDLKGVSYSAGGDWNPSQHTSFSGLVGHRYFGPTANITFRRATARTSLSLSYTRDQTNSTGSGLTPVPNAAYVSVDSALQAQFPDPIQRAQAVQSILAQSGLSTSPYGVGSFVSAQLYVQKSFQASLGLLGLRNTVVLSAFRTESQQLSNIQTTFDAFDQATAFRQTGYALNWSHKLGPQTNASASYTKTHNVAIIGTGDTRSRTMQVSVNRQISKRLSGSVALRNNVQSGSGGNTGGNFYNGNYRENQVLGSLRLTF